MEQQILQLKELYSQAARDRDNAQAEVNRLKEVLKSHGFNADLASPSTSYNTTMPSYHGSTNGSVAGSRQDSYTTGLSPSPINGAASRSPPQQQMQNGYGAQLPATHNQMDYDQLGIDFVLAYGNPAPNLGRQAYPSPPPGQ